jgi:hypothetical protein
MTDSCPYCQPQENSNHTSAERQVTRATAIGPIGSLMFLLDMIIFY